MIHVQQGRHNVLARQRGQQTGDEKVTATTTPSRGVLQPQNQELHSIPPSANGTAPFGQQPFGTARLEPKLLLHHPVPGIAFVGRALRYRSMDQVDVAIDAGLVLLRPAGGSPAYPPACRRSPPARDNAGRCVSRAPEPVACAERRLRQMQGIDDRIVVIGTKNLAKQVLAADEMVPGRRENTWRDMAVAATRAHADTGR